MDKLRIRGGRPLNGEVLISGAKNAALPELCAALLTPERVTLRNVPRLQDVSTMLKLIRNMGVQVEQGEAGIVTLQAAEPITAEAPYELVKTMRASVLALGPLLSPIRPRQGVAAGWLCDWFSPSRPASQGSDFDGGEDRGGAWLYAL
jgi:UDP-N-acetylglucosamine 1-carboxyvinyltransferase